MGRDGWDGNSFYEIELTNLLLGGNNEDPAEEEGCDGAEDDVVDAPPPPPKRPAGLPTAAERLEALRRIIATKSSATHAV